VYKQAQFSLLQLSCMSCSKRNYKCKKNIQNINHTIENVSLKI